MHLTDEVILPLMEKMKIDRDEAILRLTLMFKSGILEGGHPDHPETQRMIDDFLSMTSAEAIEKGRFAEVFETCLADKSLVANYDRLTKRNLTKCLYQLTIGNQPKDTHQQFKHFEKFVRDTVYDRIDWTQPGMTTPIELLPVLPTPTERGVNPDND